MTKKEKPADMAAFINQYKPMVTLLANRIAKKFGYRVSNDVLSQEGFLHLITLYREKKIDWENPGATNFLWQKVEGIMKNFAVREIKIKHRVISLAEFSDKTDDSAEEIDRLLPRDQSVDIHSEQRALLKVIDAYLNSLSSEERFIFVSYRTDGASFNDIGDILGCSRETARRRFRQIEASLYQFLEKNGWTLNAVEEMI